MEIFTVKRNTASEISKELVNDIFAEADGSIQFKNITDRINLGELQVDNIHLNLLQKIQRNIKIYTNQVNQVSSKCFFNIFSENWRIGRGKKGRISKIFRPTILPVFGWVL